MLLKRVTLAGDAVLPPLGAVAPTAWALGISALDSHVGDTLQGRFSAAPLLPYQGFYFIGSALRLGALNKALTTPRDSAATWGLDPPWEKYFLRQ